MLVWNILISLSTSFYYFKGSDPENNTENRKLDMHYIWGLQPLQTRDIFNLSSAK